jgi:hypothetical protein
MERRARCAPRAHCRRGHVTVRTRYGSEPGRDRIVPLEMEERYASVAERILSTAVYASFRHFTVQLSETIR